MTQVMAGVRVLEVAGYTFVPTAGGVLADWGADVIKVEHPLHGDPQRGVVYARLESDISYLYEQPNRGKRSIGLDLGSEAGREILYRLAETSDVFLTNFLPQARRRLALDVDDLRARNPHIIYARGSGQGPRGPDAERAGFDGTSYWARGGLAHSLTPDDQEMPVQSTPAIGDTPGGMIIAGGIAAALFHRERTGEAKVVDVSLFATGMWATSAAITQSEAFGLDDVKPLPREQIANPLTIMYRTRDGRSLKLSMFQGDRYWDDFCEHLGRPEVLDDPRFETDRSRADHSTDCVAALDEVFASRTLAEWRERFRTLKGSWAPVQSPREIHDDPQAVANEYIRRVDLDGGRHISLVTNPVQFDVESPVLRRAPGHAQHTDEVLLDLGLAPDEIAEHRAAGVVA